MKFFIGQKVSLLHDSGEGKVIAIIDKNHVEVDFGDDFAFDVHVDEIIPITPEQERYFSKPKEKEVAEERNAPQALGIKLLDISLAVTRESGTEYRFSLVNPEVFDILYVVLEKRKHKYQGLAYGKVDAGGKDLIGVFSTDHLKTLKSFYFQLIFYKPGTMMPQAPLICNLDWKNDLLDEDFYPIPPLSREGLLFSLRKKIKTDSAEIDAKKAVKKSTESERIIDLHIETLAIFPYQLSPGEILELQLEHVEKSLSDALIDNIERLIFIHGIGEGKLRNEIRRKLQEHPRVVNFYPADHKRFGNGATEVVLG